MRRRMNAEYKMVIVTRKDLSLSVGKLAAQVAHAAVACTLDAKTHHQRWYKKWMQTGGKKAVVKTETLDDFFPLKTLAESLDLSAIIISDAGHTEIPEGTQTVLGIGPGPENIVDQVTGNLSLL